MFFIRFGFDGVKEEIIGVIQDYLIRQHTTAAHMSHMTDCQIGSTSVRKPTTTNFGPLHKFRNDRHQNVNNL